MIAMAIFVLITASVGAQIQPDVTTVLRQGATLVNAGQLAAAQDLYEKALRGTPDDPDLSFELGMVFFRQRQWSSAIQNYTISLRHRPGKIKPLFYLAQSYFMESDLDRARQTIAQAASIAPDDAQICQKYGEYLAATIETRKQGLSWLEKARRLNPALARIDFEIGKAQFDLTDFESASSSLAVALEKDAGNGEADFYLAESRANLSEWEKASESYAHALAHGYESGSAYYGLGRAQVELGELEAAVSSLGRALAIQPSLIKAHFQLAKAYRQLGRTQESQQETTLFAAMTDRVDTSGELKTPEEEQAWKQVKPLLEANQEQAALHLLKNLPVAADTDSAGPQYLLGTMYYSMGRKDDAKRVLTLARTQAPTSARIAAYLGMVQLSSGNVTSALEAFQAALAHDSNETLALIGMGGIRYQQQRWPQAVEYLEKSRTADPDALFLLCDAYYRMGKPEQAALIAEVVRALGSDRKPLLDELEKLVARHRSDRP
jgi:tetratricopeptide (TPR) repeat protein